MRPSSTRSRLVALAAILALSLTAPAQAQELTIYQDQGNLIRAPQAVTTLGADLFGDQVNLYTGSLEFIQTDVSLPGNNALPISVGRRLITGDELAPNGQFGQWDLEIPHLHGVYALTWTVPGVSNSGTRCTNFGAPPIQPGSFGTTGGWEPYEYWHGHYLYIPGSGDQELLRSNASSLTPSDGNSYPVVTAKQWALRCLPSLANDPTPTKTWGEGFIAVSPEGTQYRFDWYVTRPLPVLIQGSLETRARSRQAIWIMPTLVTDRFGNTVTYTYDAAAPWRLTSMAASDGRSISLTYVSGTNRVQSVSDGTRTWSYGYVAVLGGSTLSTVTLPDQTVWQLANASNLLKKLEYTLDPDCNTSGTLDATAHSATLTHPSGAIGTFILTPTLHGRTAVQKQCKGDTTTGTYSRFTNYYATDALTTKSISGPGLTPLNWTYAYSTANASWAPCTGCADTQTVDVTDPKGDVTRYTYGNRYLVSDGKLQKIEVLAAGVTPLRTSTTRYRSAGAGPYPGVAGISAQTRGDSGITSQFLPLDQTIISQQGTSFTWQANSFDTKVRPLSVTKSSTLSATPNTRTETTAYHDNLSKWILGQTASQTESSTGAVMLSRSFDASNANILTTSRFGRLEQTNTYHPDGTLATRKDGLNQTTTFSNYKRGLAQNILYANGSSQSAVVDNRGLITALTDANGFTTNYGYDTIGRLSLITQPSGDPVTWNSTTLSFVPVASAEFGLPAGHWRQTIATGNGNAVTYVDALWRPVMSRTFDATDQANTRSVVVRTFDHQGRTTYASYPQRDIASVTATPAGSRNTYDALSRITTSTADSELGTLTTSNAYLSGFQTQTTNPRAKITTSSFQAFDQPSEAAPLTITAPENLSVAITRDVFGKPLSITRSGGGNSATRSYVYDSNQRLCKHIEPETGATLQDYDAANNTLWRASGTTLTSLICDRASVPAAKKVSYSYDTLNRLTNTSYADGSPAISRTYTADSLPLTVSTSATASAAATTWTTSYNRRRLPTQESFNAASQTYHLTRAFDANGTQNQLTYPDGTSISANPNALGQARQVGTFATSIAYHPNGAISSFSYGNAIPHTLSQNTRGLPLQANDVGVIKDLYAFDQNANVASITDNQNSAASNTTRSMSYDNLDRLATTVAANLWGTASYSYDVLDNLRTSALSSGTTARIDTHNYDAQNRLSSIASNQSSFNLSYSYDAQGNITLRGTQGFAFDQGNRLNTATAKADYRYDGLGHRWLTNKTDGTSIVSIYSPGGALLYGVQTGGPNPSKTTKYVHLNRHLLAEVVTGGSPSTTYTHTDGLGSPVAKTNTAGGIVSRTNYEPYGMTLNGVPPAPTGDLTIGFTGHVSDANTGLTYMQQRYYDPLAGRFLSEDPVLTDANTGASFNRYVYVENNPYKFVDPDGRIVWFAPILVPMTVGAVVGGGLNAAMQYYSTGTVQWGGLGGVIDAAGDGATLGMLGGAIGAGRTRAGTEASSLPDSAVVVRGGENTAARIANASGAKLNPDGTVSGVSVNSAAGKSVAELSQTIPHGQVGTTTVGKVREAGGDVIPKPTGKNPDHCEMCGITPKKAEDLLTPTQPNPQ